jgi:ectoine hydroxylase-related dioxygenase (phytanoyl-CoA dioxygenase family)
VDVPGWGPWSAKEGMLYAHAPAAALEHVVALRVHLDDSTRDNGPLRVVPGSHRGGVLSDEDIGRLVAVSTHTCEVGGGGVLVMRPLLVHASSKARSDTPRRVLHLEYARRMTFDPGLELAIA